jgi:hypothetical protein
MRLPYHLFRTSTFRSEPLLAAMAAVSVGMFVGAWLIGPAITRDSAVPTPAPAPQARTSFEEMVSRPDPSPYRAATPDFGPAGAPNYAAAAKEKAQAELGGQIPADNAAADDEAVPQESASTRTRARYPSFDRHHVY